MPKDKILHVILGFIWATLSALIILVLTLYGIGPAIAASTTVYAIVYELNQWYRKEGHPEMLDAVCTALPGYLIWLFLVI